MVRKCAENFRALRKKGIRIRRTNEVIIARFCIERRMPLLFCDRDFLPYEQRISGLMPAVSFSGYHTHWLHPLRR